MNYNYRYRLKPTEAQRETLDYHRDTCRQLYNHALYRFNQIPEDEGTVKQRVRTIRDELPDLKDWWDALTDVYSKVLQPTVMRVAKNINALGKLKEQGYKVGELRWKSPREFRSFTYNQSGFELDKKGGQTVLSLSKLADIPIEFHRPLPDDATVKEVTLKKEKTGEWFAIFGIERDTEPPAKPSLEKIDAEKVVGIDVGIRKYAHDTDGTAVESLDLSEDRNRLEREQRKLSRKEYASNNWEKQRQTVAECHLRIKRKRRDFLHKLSNYYAREYELVAVEDLDVKGMLESPRNSPTRRRRHGTPSPRCSKRSVSVKARTSWKLNPTEPPKSALSVASKPTNRYGCGNTPAPRVGSMLIEMRMRRGTFFLADSPN